MVRGELRTRSLRHHIMRTGVSWNWAGFVGPYYTERCSAPQSPHLSRTRPGLNEFFRITHVETVPKVHIIQNNIIAHILK
jgi:hypothetical protein